MAELWRLTATETVALLKRREVSPLELIDAAMTRIEATNPQLNSLVTLCLDRARKHAQRIMQHPPAGEFLLGDQVWCRKYKKTPACAGVNRGGMELLLLLGEAYLIRLPIS